MFKIRSFGQDAECHSIQTLKGTLMDRYAGKSVSIVFPTKPHGLLRTVFVDVSAQGSLTDSYGEQGPIDFQSLASEHA